MTQTDFIEMKVPAKSEFVSVVRLTASGIAHRLGFSYDDIEDIKVAISEATTNAVDHAYAENEEGKIKIGFGICSDRLEVMVADHGQSFDFEKAIADAEPFHEETPVQQLNEGGLGLFLMEALMDKVDIRAQEGVMVLMTKFIQGDGVTTDDEKVPTS